MILCRQVENYVTFREVERTEVLVKFGFKRDHVPQIRGGARLLIETRVRLTELRQQRNSDIGEI
jgi:hypothetical protein